MCLDLHKDAKKQVATEDIICYKRIIGSPDLTSYAGKSFTGIIKEFQCEGKIHIENNKSYFCTNEPSLDGADCSDKLGYKYSWVMDSKVKSIIVEDIDLMMLTENNMFVTPYQHAKVKIGETYVSELISDRYSVNIGLHSFTNYEDARNDGDGVVVKCIIPKGAEYYEGLFYGDKSYTSNELKYLETINE